MSDRSDTQNEFRTLESVRAYYGEVLQSTKDLKTSACCTSETLPPHLRAIVAEIHPEVLDRFYGCGSPIPPALDGATVLDLGCGTGRDCFLLSKLVGESGHVIGIDMTDSQLEVARRHEAYHAKKFGYARPNTRFVAGYIEDLETAGVASNSVDVVVSNCVLNLSPNKQRVFSEIFRVLKPGGELYISDVFASRRVPRELTRDPVLLGECLGGALYLKDFGRLVHGLGCLDYRVVARSPISLADESIAKKIGMVEFSSVTVRAFKLDLEDASEDYGHVAYYLGGLPESAHGFFLDERHLFKTGMPVPVCGNTAAMLTGTRYAKYFRVVGDRSVHYGAAACGPLVTPLATTGKSTSSGASCC